MGNAAIVKELLEASADVDAAREVGLVYSYHVITVCACLKCLEKIFKICTYFYSSTCLRFQRIWTNAVVM